MSQRRSGVLGSATRTGGALLAACAVVALAGCSESSTPRNWAPADVVLAGDDFPSDFTHQQVTVESIRDANFPVIEQAAAATYRPEKCRPTADAYVNPRLTRDNAAVVGRARTTEGQATSASDTIVELVTTVRRDIAADRASTSGACARVSAEIASNQVQAGGTVTSEFTPLAANGIGGGVDYVVYRQDVTTQIPDNPEKRSRTLAGYAVVQGPGQDNLVTVQLVANVAVDTKPALDDARFAKLFVTAVSRARSVLHGG